MIWREAQDGGNQPAVERMTALIETLSNDVKNFTEERGTPGAGTTLG